MKKFLRNLFWKKLFSHSEEYRSDSEKMRYTASVFNALQSQKSFENFKQDKFYQDVLEHVSESQGLQFLKVMPC